MNKLTDYLKYYYKIQKNIILVYKPYEHSGWNNRCLYQQEDYNVNTPYNHRSILDNEVVIEYDYEDKSLNKKYVDVVALRLKSDGIEYIKWFTGNKSVHLRVLLKTHNVSNCSLLKRVFIRYYCRELPLPDLQLTGRHLVRAEYGIHEKTSVKMKIISKTSNYPCLSVIPQVIWDEYKNQYSAVMKRKMTINLKDLSNHPVFQIFNNSTNVKIIGDGRERILFVLIHVLKSKWINNKKGFIKYLQDWYRYTDGNKLSPFDIARKVDYHWNRKYIFGEYYLNNLYEELTGEKL